MGISNDLTGINLDVFLVHEAGGADEEKESMYTDVVPSEEIELVSLEGDFLQIVISRTSQVVSEIHVTPDHRSYNVSMADLVSLSVDIFKASYESGYTSDELEEEEEEDEEIQVKFN